MNQENIVDANASVPLSEDNNQGRGSESTKSLVGEYVDKNLQIDIYPMAILARAGIQITPESLNQKIEINEGKMTIAELDRVNGCVMTTAKDGSNIIEVNGITSTGEYIELSFGVAFHLKGGGGVFAFRSTDDISTVESTEVVLHSGKIYRASDYNPSIHDEVNSKSSNRDDIFMVNGKEFIPAYKEDPTRVNAVIR